MDVERSRERAFADEPPDVDVRVIEQHARGRGEAQHLNVMEAHARGRAG